MMEDSPYCRTTQNILDSLVSPTDLGRDQGVPPSQRYLIRPPTEQKKLKCPRFTVDLPKRS